MNTRLEVYKYGKKRLTLPSVDAATIARLNKTDEEVALMTGMYISAS
jgi:hypothetical protein